MQLLISHSQRSKKSIPHSVTDEINLLLIIIVPCARLRGSSPPSGSNAYEPSPRQLFYASPKTLPQSSCTALNGRHLHYGDVIMDVIASQITSLTMVYSTFYSGADQSKHQSSASLAFVRGIHRDR